MKHIIPCTLLLVLGLFFILFYFSHSHKSSIFVYADNSSYCIVLDAGHGANDPGKIGVNNALEKDINLAIVQGLKPLLENKGFRVILTRDSDDILADLSSSNVKLSDMQGRVQRIRQANPIFTISIHQNSYVDSSIYGPQVFYYDKSQEGKALATSLQNRLDHTLSISSSRGIKANDDYFMLKKTPTPTVLVECGFLSNPREADLLILPAYQDKLVRSIYLGITDYLKNISMESTELPAW